MGTPLNNATTTKILLLEDDVSLIDGLEYALIKNGFDVETVRTVGEAMNRLALRGKTTSVMLDDISAASTIDSISQYNLLLLDVTLPDGTGFEVCEKVRTYDRQIPIIFLTASDEEVNVIRGLDGGADDYITKPFKIGELCSRIRALLRRSSLPAPPSASSLPSGLTQTAISSGVLTIDLASSRVTLNGTSVELTKAEYRLLALLVRNAGQIVTREIILNELWDSAGDYVDDNTLSVYVRRLREKIEATPSQPKHLITVRGFGYRWES